MILCEIEYKDSEGKPVIESIEGWQTACDYAKTRAGQIGRAVTIRKKPRPQWYVITADLETGDVTRIPLVMTKREAVAFWIDWKPKQERAICILWPAWAKEPTIIIQTEACSEARSSSR